MHLVHWTKQHSLVRRATIATEEEEILGGYMSNEEENLPGEGMSNDEALDFPKIKSFCANILKTLVPPLLKDTEGAKRLNAAAEPFMPRRIMR
jgi:hypothetical protein